MRVAIRTEVPDSDDLRGAALEADATLGARVTCFLAAVFFADVAIIDSSA